MKKIQRGLFPSVVCGLFSTMMLPGCIGNGTTGGNEVSVDSIPMDTTVYLDEANTESPKCQIKINFKYLKSADENDSLHILQVITCQAFLDRRDKGPWRSCSGMCT